MTTHIVNAQAMRDLEKRMQEWASQAAMSSTKVVMTEVTAMCKKVSGQAEEHRRGTDQRIATVEEALYQHRRDTDSKLDLILQRLRVMVKLAKGKIQDWLVAT